MKAAIYFIMLLCTIFMLSISEANAKDKNNSLIGEWIYQVSDAPDEYKTGSIIFSKNDGEINCIIKLDAGELTASNLKIDNEKVNFSVYIDGSPVNVALIIDKDKLSGTVDSPEGPKEITANKKSKE